MRHSYVIHGPVIFPIAALTFCFPSYFGLGCPASHKGRDDYGKLLNSIPKGRDRQAETQHPTAKGWGWGAPPWRFREGAEMEKWKLGSQTQPPWPMAHAHRSWTAVPTSWEAQGRWSSTLAAELLLCGFHIWRRSREQGHSLSKDKPFLESPY